jgi:hypothetical protein
MVCQLRIS